MSFANRQESILDFQDDPNIQVMIASLKAGGMGLDLTMANKCILVEPWWNDAVQQQAFCRLFRIGQTKSVEIIKLVVKDTIDDYMLELQTRKNKEIDGAIGTEALSSRNTIAELLKLFVPVEDDGTNGF
jgi:SNF2 family DNA or RNA helicase